MGDEEKVPIKSYIPGLVELSVAVLFETGIVDIDEARRLLALPVLTPARREALRIAGKLGINRKDGTRFPGYVLACLGVDDDESTTDS